MQRWERFLLGACLCLLLVFSLAASALAEPQLFSADGEYVMGDGETMAEAEERARLEAMRNAAEKAGIYLESFTVVQDMQLSKDELRVIAGSILRVQDATYQRRLVGDSLVIAAHVEAMVDSLDIDALRDRLKDKTAREDYARLLDSYEKTQADNAVLREEIRDLREQLGRAQAPAQREQAVRAIERTERAMDASNWLYEGSQWLWKKNYYLAIEAYTKALELAPGSADAYIGRGLARRGKGEPQLALQDFTAALGIAPSHAEAWVLRGQLHEALRNDAQAWQDYGQAIAANPGHAEAYLARAELSRRQQREEDALADYQAALALDKSLADAWYGAAQSHERLGHMPAAAHAYEQYLAHADARGYSYKLLDARRRLQSLRGA